MDTRKRDPVRNPREGANPLSRIFFWWLRDAFAKGSREGFDEENLYSPLSSDRSEDLGEKLESNWEDEVERSKELRKEPSLERAVLATFGWDLFLTNLYYFFNVCVARIGLPFFLKELISFFQSEQKFQKDTGYIFACSLLATSFLIAFCYTHGHLKGRQLGMRLRIACSSLLYHKILKLPSNTGAQGDTGQVINLLSNDVNKFDRMGQEICYLAATPIQVIATAYCLWAVGGISGIIGLFFLLALSVPFQAIIAKVIMKFRWKTAEATDRRVRITSEVVSLIKGVKMYTWEEYFQSMINLIRIEEMHNIRKTGYLFSLAISFSVITERLILFGTLLCFIFLDMPITPEQVFALASMYNSLQYTLSIHFPFAVEATAEARVSFQRIQKFLLQNEMEAFHYSRRSSSLKENKSPVEAINATAAWLVNFTKPALHGINFEIKMGSLCAIVGHVGSGKSSLLQAILSELPLKEGKLAVRGKVSYMPQQSWLFDGTLRQNILFGNPYEEKRYNEVIRVCALTTDLQQLPHNDLTIVGDKGFSLSGGQRARVSLARCIYYNADIYLLDDPLSSIDCRVSKEIFEDCIVSFLHDKTRIVVTHQLQYLPQVDFIIVLNNGKIENQGSYNAVIEEIKDTNQFLNVTGDNVTENIETLSNNNISDAGNHIQNGKIKHTEDKHIDEHTELILKGKVKHEVYIKYFLAGSKWYSILLLIILFILGQIASSGSDFWVAYWSNLEEMRQHYDASVSNVNISEKSTPYSAFPDQSLFNQLDVSYDLYTFNKILQPRQLLLTNKDILLNIQMNNDFTAYNFSEEVVDENYESKHLLPYKSGTSNSSFLEKSFPNNEIESTSNVTSFESEQKIEVNIFDTRTCIFIHTVLIIACIIVTISRGIFFINTCISSSLSLHKMVLESLIKGTMRFFDTNPAGRILNRMFKDLGFVDDMLPRDMMLSLQIFSTMLGLASLLIVTNYWLILPVIITVLLYVKLTQLYMKTAENIKRLEGKMRSPVFSHVNATTSGVHVIRAFQHQDIVKKEFYNHQDIHSTTWFLSIACSAAFGFWMDCISITFSASVIFTFIIFENDMVGSEVGLCVSQCLVLLSMAQSGIRYMAEVANNMTSVERLLQYTEIEQEEVMNLATGMKSPTNWPSEGSIQFSGVSLRYADSLPLVLKNLDFKIESCQRVGIVGRTGSGKSSIISALLRLAPLNGDIIIDGINIRKLCLKDLRRNITVIPQEPILFSASLRDSLDPNNRQPDHEIWAALEEVGLKDSISSLEMLINEGGSNLSVGQRQLVCLARAVLQKNKILILDEATANVDSGTDDLIQEAIRQYFGHCTVLSISHRLKNVMDMDRIFVMNDGILIEQGHPHILLQNESGLFYKMVEQLGQPLGHQLREIAKKAFESYNDGK